MNRTGRVSDYRFRLEDMARYSPLKFGALMVAAIFALKILFIPLILLGGGGDTTTPVFELGPIVILASFFLLPVETLIGQTFPVWLLRELSVMNWRWLMVGSAVLFGLLHAPAGLGAFFVGFSAGIPLAFAWLVWRKESFLRALVGTTLVHAVHNVIAFALFGCGLLLTG